MSLEEIRRIVYFGTVRYGTVRYDTIRYSIVKYLYYVTLGPDKVTGDHFVFLHSCFDFEYRL